VQSPHQTERASSETVLRRLAILVAELALTAALDRYLVHDFADAVTQRPHL
jgi:hypothetical protein